LGEIETPFFGAPKKEKRRERRKRTPFFAVGGFVGPVCQQACPVDGLRLAYDWAGPLWRRAYTAS
jgi:hypothetical protein